MQYWFATSTEEFTPSQMLEQAKAADRAGFDGLGTSDHFAPWFPDGQATQAWVYLGALGQVTQKQIGTAVTPIVHHYHPGLVRGGGEVGQVILIGKSKKTKKLRVIKVHKTEYWACL